MKKIVLLTALIGAAAAQASNFNISIRDAHNFHDAVRNRNAQLLANVQNRNGVFIPLNDARELMAVINDVIDSDNAYGWMRNFFAGYNNINRRNIGSFSNIWQQVVDQANQPLPIVRIMPQPAAAQRPVANPPAVPQAAPTVFRSIRRGAVQTPQPLNIDLNTAHHQTVGESQPQISPALDREIDNFLESMNLSSTPLAGTPILLSISNFFKIIGERNLNPDAVIAAFKRINFEDINTTALIERFAAELNGNDKNWAVIASRFFAVRKAFLEIKNDDPYKLAFLGFIPSSDDDAADLGAEYGSRGGEVIAQLLNIYDDSMPVLFNVLHSINKNEAVGLARLFDGDMKVLLYFGSALEFDYTANRIVFPELLKTLFMNAAEFNNIVENNYVSKDIEASDLFIKLLGDEQFNEWSINFSNEYCGSVFIKALGVLFHNNKDYYGGSIENVHRDLNSNNANITWNELLLAPVTDLFIKKDLDTEAKKREFFVEMLTGSFSKMFSTNDFHNLYPGERLPYEDSSRGGIANVGHFNRNTMIFLFCNLKNLLDDNSKGNVEKTAEIAGQLIQGFWNCPAGQSNAVRVLVRYLMSNIKLPENISLLDLLKTSISMSCQDKMGHIFHFMVWKEMATRLVGANSYDNIFAVERNDLVEYSEETMCLKYVYYLLKGAYGLPKENIDYSYKGREVFHMLQLHLLSQLGNPYVETALLAVYESKDHPEIRKYGADMLGDKCGERFYEWGRVMYRDGGMIQELPAGSSDISYTNMDIILQTMLYAVMNDTQTVMCDIIENGVFWSKIVQLFDKNHDELPDFQTLLNICLEGAEPLSLRFLTYVFQHTENPDTATLLGNEKQKPELEPEPDEYEYNDLETIFRMFGMRH